VELCLSMSLSCRYVHLPAPPPPAKGSPPCRNPHFLSYSCYYQGGSRWDGEGQDARHAASQAACNSLQRGGRYVGEECNQQHTLERRAGGATLVGDSHHGMETQSVAL